MASTDSEPVNFEVIVGTYEEFLLGYKLKQKDKKHYIFAQSFATHVHSASVRTLSQAGRYLASGAADDRVFVYNMETRKEHTILTHHKGTVNALEFTSDATHLISVSDDGSIATTRTGNWQLEKVWSKAHNGMIVSAVGIHPSNKLLLTIGADGTLRTWNLIKGRQAFVIRLQPEIKNANSIVWNSNGERFILFSNKRLEVWNIEQGGCEKFTDRESNVSCVRWLDEKNMVVGHEDGTVDIFNSLDLSSVFSLSAHDARIKGMSVVKNFIVTGSSAGDIKLWKWKNDKLELRGSTSIGCRITCLTTVPIECKKVKAETDDETKTDPNPKPQKKRKV